MFIETGGADPLVSAAALATQTDTGYKGDGTEYDQRYQEMIPGQIMYGSAGQKPHVVSAQRPGATFEPFVKTIEKSISMALNIPHPVLFKDFQGINFASYRSAMLEAWRVVRARRQWLSSGLCRPVWRMLMEESYLRGDLAVSDYYEQEDEYTAADWVGPPKGQIEPIKEIQADTIAIQNNLKSREEVAIEQGRDLRKTFNQLADEQDRLKELGLDEAEFVAGVAESFTNPDDDEGEENANN